MREFFSKDARSSRSGPKPGRQPSVATIFVCALALLAPSHISRAQDVQFFRIGTGASESSYFLLGGIIASAISNPPGSRSCDRGGSCGVPGLIAVAQSTEGSVANINAIRKGELESGLAQADIAYWATLGKAPFAKEKPFESLRAIANLHQDPLQVLVREDSRIQDISDLKGKRLAVGPRDSAAHIAARAVLEAYGLSEKSVRLSHLTVESAAETMREGKLDALFFIGTRNPAIANLADDIPLRLIPLLGEKIAALRQKHSFYVVDIIPEGLYDRTLPTVTIGVGILWVVPESLEESRVYALTEALWHTSTRKLLNESGSFGQQMTLDTAISGLSVPLHPGAARYYRERLASQNSPATEPSGNPGE